MSGENIGVVGDEPLGAGRQEEGQRRDEDPDGEREHEHAPERDGPADRAGDGPHPSSSSASRGDRGASRAALLDIEGLPHSERI